MAKFLICTVRLKVLIALIFRWHIIRDFLEYLYFYNPKNNQIFSLQFKIIFIKNLQKMQKSRFFTAEILFFCRIFNFFIKVQKFFLKNKWFHISMNIARARDRTRISKIFRDKINAFNNDFFPFFFVKFFFEIFQNI